MLILKLLDGSLPACVLLHMVKPKTVWASRNSAYSQANQQLKVNNSMHVKNLKESTKDKINKWLKWDIILCINCGCLKTHPNNALTWLVLWHPTPQPLKKVLGKFNTNWNAISDMSVS